MTRAEVDGLPLPISSNHDVQMAVAGPIAKAVGQLARERWRRANKKTMLMNEQEKVTRWPTWLVADIEDVGVASVRYLTLMNILNRWIIVSVITSGAVTGFLYALSGAVISARISE